jgi:formylglycine-generating enzyme required for sulfatase activity
MVDIGSVCIDRYEAPNQRGVKPLLMQSAIDGEAWCRDHDKRLCREDEWLAACMGAERRSFPYGDAYEAGRCNDDKTWRAPKWSALRQWPAEVAEREAARLDQSEAAGQRADCKSDAGVFDLSGNAAEWVVRTEDNDTNHDHVVKGCYWARCFRPPHIPSCDYVNFAHRSEERSYEMGFRCCRNRN